MHGEIALDFLRCFVLFCFFLVFVCFCFLIVLIVSNSSGNSERTSTLITIIVGVDIDLTRGTFHQTGSPRYGLLKLTLFLAIFFVTNA